MPNWCEGNIRLRGMQFSQEIEIVNGELTKEVEIKYDDWTWECPMPNMGG